MRNNILEASVRLYAEDSALRASFQGLAPQAHLAGVTVGERFAAGVGKAAAQAHSAFQKEFIGPLQSEAFGTGIGRGMDARPADQFRASDLAAHKGVVTAVQSHGQALAMSGEKAEAWNLSVREATLSAKVFAGTLVSAVNPELGAMIQVGGEAVRALKGMGVAFAGAGTGVAIGAVAVGFYIDRVKQAVDAKARLDAAVFRKDPAGAQSETDRRTAEFDDLISKQKQAEGRSAGGLFGGLFGDKGRSLGEAIAFYSSVFKNTETERKKLAESQADTDKLTRQIRFPQIDAHAAVEENQLLIQKLSLERLSVGTLDELTASTQRLRAAKEALVEAAIKELDVTERVKAQNVFDAAAKRGAPVSQDVQAKILDDITRRQRNLREADKAVAADDRRQANRDRVAIEERQRAHAVELGRISMADQLAAERAATMDMGRTVQEREDAERKVFQTKRQMAESFLTFQSQLTGKSLFTERLDVARGFLSELVAGSAAWFAQTSKIADLFAQMREQAKGVFSQQVGIAESEASRRGKTSISLDELPDYLRQVRERDERALGGGRVRIGDLSGAVGRMDLFRQIDREGLSPREAFSRLTEDPSRRLARLLDGVGGSAGAVTPALGEMGNAAIIVTRALLGMAEALGQGGVRGSRGGGPGLSEENRRAILATNQPFGAQPPISTDVDSALGRNLFLSGRRGPITSLTMP